MKREGDVPKPDDVDEPNRGADELVPNAEDDPKSEDEVDPKGPDEDDAPKGEELNADVEDELPKPGKVGVFGANGLVDVVEENGLEDGFC